MIFAATHVMRQDVLLVKWPSILPLIKNCHACAKMWLTSACYYYCSDPSKGWFIVNFKSLLITSHTHKHTNTHKEYFQLLNPKWWNTFFCVCPRCIQESIISCYYPWKIQIFGKIMGPIIYKWFWGDANYECMFKINWKMKRKDG